MNAEKTKGTFSTEKPTGRTYSRTTPEPLPELVPEQINPPPRPPPAQNQRRRPLKSSPNHSTGNNTTQPAAVTPQKAENKGAQSPHHRNIEKTPQRPHTPPTPRAAHTPSSTSPPHHPAPPPALHKHPETRINPYTNLFSGQFWGEVNPRGSADLYQGHLGMLEVFTVW